MKYKIEKLNDTDAVVISDEEIKENTNTFKEGINGDWFWCAKYNKIANNGDITAFDFKVIATISPFKIEGLPMIELPKRDITGYRLKPNIEKEMINRLLDYSMPNWDDNDKSVYFIRGHVGGSLVAKLKELGVLNLWFTPIYDEDIKTWCKEHHYDYYYKEGLMAELPNKNEVTGTDDNRSKPNYCYAKIEQGEEKGCIFPACHCGLPNQEVNVEKMAELKYPISKGGSMWMPTVDDCNKANKQEGFIEGYKAAQKQFLKI